MRKIWFLSAFLFGSFLPSFYISAQQPLALLGNHNGTLTPFASSATYPVLSSAPTTAAYGYNATGVAWGQVVSGIVVTGNAGQTCLLTAFNNSSTAAATVYLTGVNTIASNTPIQITSAGSGATAAPTTAVAGNGTATCSGVATLLTGLGAYVPIAVDANGNLPGGGSISLTTLGTSGASTLIGTVLNIPVYSGGNLSGTVSATHLTMGTGANTVGDSPATYASSLFTFPNNTLTGTNPTAFTNWSELSWTSFLELAGRLDNGLDAFPVGSGIFYQLNDQNAVGLGSDPSASGSVSTVDWIRNNVFSGMAEVIGAMGQVYVHGNGTTAAGLAYGTSGQVFIDNNVNEATADYALNYLNLSGSGSPSVTNINGLRTELDVGGAGSVGTYTGVEIGYDNGFIGSGATVQHSRGLHVGAIGQGAIDNFAIYVDDQVQDSKHWAIRTGNGQVEFGDAVRFDNLPTTTQTSVVGIDSSGNLYKNSAPTISAANMTSFPTSVVTTAATQMLTNKTVDGVTPTVFGFVDPTSSIQTQLNGKQASGTYVTAVSVATANGVSGSSSGGATPALTIALGAITPTSTNGVSAATMAFMDATSSVQTQLNSKQSSSVSNPITSATGGSGTGTVTCATASCTNLRGSYTVAGGTFATGTLLTLVWPTTTTAYVCIGNVLNNATGASIGYHSIATATGMTFSSLTAATGLSVDIDYSCQP